MKRTALVTGATGGVGRNVVNELLKEDWDIIILHRPSSDLTKLAGCRVRFREVDLYDLDSVKQAVPENADAIFHVAGNTSHHSADAAVQWKDNVLATRHLVEVALEKKVKRFIFTSTGATLPYMLFDEKNATEIRQNYIRTKRLAEIEVQKGMEQGLDAIILQPIIVIGPYDYNAYAEIFRGLKSGEIKGCFPGRIMFCHAVDVARAHVQAFHKGRGGESYILSGPHTSWQECFNIIAKRVGARLPRVYSIPTLKMMAKILAVVSFFTKRKPLLTPDLIKLTRDYGDISLQEKRKSKEVLGYESRGLEEMINDCYEWLVATSRIESQGRSIRRPQNKSNSLGHDHGSASSQSQL